jgi:hypothetical protein
MRDDVGHAFAIIVRRWVEGDDQLIKVRLGVLVQGNRAVDALGSPPALGDGVTANVERAQLEQQLFRKLTVQEHAGASATPSRGPRQSLVCVGAAPAASDSVYLAGTRLLGVGQVNAGR